jgi:hypothetical protein
VEFARAATGVSNAQHAGASNAQHTAAAASTRRLPIAPMIRKHRRSAGSCRQRLAEGLERVRRGAVGVEVG